MESYTATKSKADASIELNSIIVDIDVLNVYKIQNLAYKPTHVEEL